jgi:hypothetical protein
MTMGHHPAVCTVCCKRAATNRDETFRDSLIDSCYVAVAFVQMVLQFVFLPAALVIPAALAMMSHKRTLGRRANDELQRLKREKRQALHDEQTELHKIATRLNRIHDLERENVYLRNQPPDPKDLGRLRRQIEDNEREQQRLRDKIPPGWVKVEQARAKWQETEKRRIRVEHPLGGPR